MTRKAVLALPLALLAPPALESCRDPTEIKEAVSTDLDCPGVASPRPAYTGVVLGGATLSFAIADLQLGPP